VLHLQRLASCGVSFHSYTEPMLSTDNEMIRDIVLAVMASLAKIERQKISERTKAGMECVRQHGSKSGKTIGRPRISDRTRTQIVGSSRAILWTVSLPVPTAFAVARMPVPAASYGK
jgi:putative DNA-invertase from lambdoid prophage Rac